MKIGSLLRALHYAENETNLLYEYYQGIQYELKQHSKEIVKKWISQCKADTANLDFSNDLKCPAVVADPIKPFDYVLRYFYAIARNLIEVKPQNMAYLVRNEPIILNFVVTDTSTIITGKTGKADVGGGEYIIRTQIFLPVNLITDIVVEFMSGNNSYQYIQKFITKLGSTLNHELTHALQFIKRVEDNSDQYNLKKFNLTYFTQFIDFVVYFIENDELKAEFNECYAESKVRGNYTSTEGIRPKSKRKNFVDTLICNFLERLHEEEISDAYQIGSISFEQLTKKIMPPALFLIIWVIFVYGLRDSGMEKLILRDDVHNIRKRFDLGIIDHNMMNLIKFIAQFHNEEELQEMLVKNFNESSLDQSVSLFFNMFDMDLPNDDVLNSLEAKLSLDNGIEN